MNKACLFTVRNKAKSLDAALSDSRRSARRSTVASTRPSSHTDTGFASGPTSMESLLSKPLRLQDSATTYPLQYSHPHKEPPRLQDSAYPLQYSHPHKEPPRSRAESSMYSLQYTHPDMGVSRSQEDSSMYTHPHLDENRPYTSQEDSSAYRLHTHTHMDLGGSAHTYSHHIPTQPYGHSLPGHTLTGSTEDLSASPKTEKLHSDVRRSTPLHSRSKYAHLLTSSCAEQNRWTLYHTQTGQLSGYLQEKLKSHCEGEDNLQPPWKPAFNINSPSLETTSPRKVCSTSKSESSKQHTRSPGQKKKLNETFTLSSPSTVDTKESVFLIRGSETITSEIHVPVEVGSTATMCASHIQTESHTPSHTAGDSDKARALSANDGSLNRTHLEDGPSTNQAHTSEHNVGDCATSPRTLIAKDGDTNVSVVGDSDSNQRAEAADGSHGGSASAHIPRAAPKVSVSVGERGRGIIAETRNLVQLTNSLDKR